MHFPRISHSIFFDIVYFRQHDYFKIHSKLWNSYAIVPFFYSCKVFQYIDILEFLIHLPVNSCSNFLQFGSSTNKTAVKTHAQISIQAYFFFFFSIRLWLWSRMAGTYGRSSLDYLRKCQTIFQSSYIYHPAFPPPCMRVSVTYIFARYGHFLILTIYKMNSGKLLSFSVFLKIFND